MKRGLLVLVLMTLGVGPLSRAAENVGLPGSRFSYGKIEWVDKMITCKRLEWREEQVQRPVTRCTCEIRPVQRVVMVPTLVDSVRFDIDIIKTPRTEIRTMQKCRLVPVLMYDNLTKCCFMSMRREYFTVQVPFCQIDTHVIPRNIPVKVCKLCPQVKTFDEQFLVPRTQMVCEVHRFPVFVPYQKCVRVPVCMPSPVPVPLPSPGLSAPPPY